MTQAEHKQKESDLLKKKSEDRKKLFNNYKMQLLTLLSQMGIKNIKSKRSREIEIAFIYGIQNSQYYSEKSVENDNKWFYKFATTLLGSGRSITTFELAEYYEAP